MKKKTCPKCGGVDVLKIRYGYPLLGLVKAAERGEVHLGGCVTFEDSPAWHCECGHEFGIFGGFDGKD